MIPFFRNRSVEKVLLIAPLLLGSVYISWGQKNFIVRKFEESNGLSSNFTENLSQGKSGHLIIANKRGVDRFDGKTFEPFIPSWDTTGLGYVTALYNSQQEIWYGTFDGNIGTINHQTTLIKTGVSGQIKHLFKDVDNGIWAFSRSGMVFWANGGDTSRYDMSERDMLINAVIPYKNKEFIIGSNEGLWLIRFESGNDFQVLRRIEGLPETKITALRYEAGKDRLWVATEDAGLHLVRSPFTSLQSISIFKLDNGSSIDDVHSIFADHLGRIWFGTLGKGLVRVEFHSERSNDYDVLRFNDHLDPQLLIRDVFEDNENNIWIATFGAGLYQIVENAFHQPFSDKWLKNQTITQLFRDSKGNIWLGIDKGIFRTSERGSAAGFSYYHLAGNEVSSIAEDRFGKIWVGTAHSGVYRLSPGASNFEPVSFNKGKLENAINNITVTQDAVLVSTKAGLLELSFNGQVRSQLTTLDGLPHNNVRISYLDNSGKLWIACQGNRICYLKQNKVHFIESGDQPLVVDVNYILQDQQDRIWFSTMGQGVTVLENSRTIHVDSRHGLPSDYCYQMVLDNDGFVWVSHQKSITQLSSELKINRVIVREELSPSENSAVSFLFKDIEGNIWISSTHNVVKFNPTIDKSSKTPPQLSISAMRVFGKEQLMTDRLRLPYDKYEIEFQLAGISLRDPQGIKYKYQWKGVSDTWLIHEGNDKIQGTLGYGDYTLTVYASKNGGEWTAEPVVYSFSIARPFWLTWWAWMLGIIAIAMGLLGFVRYRTYRLLTDKADLEKIVTERTLEIQEQKSEIERSRDEIAKYAKDITDSMKYAKRIQKAIFPTWRDVQDVLPDFFVFFQSKDLVSGDFYFAEKVGSKRIFCAVDCTGHGVPGGFMSIVANNLLQQAIKQVGLTKPSDILEYLNLGVSNTLHQTYEESAVKDGMDIALCCWDVDTNVLEFAGAYNPLYIFRDGKYIEYKGDRFPVGTFVGEEIRKFTNHTISLKSGDMLYIFSDGYADQFGGPFGKKFMLKRFRMMLAEVHKLPLTQQHDHLAREFRNWKGHFEQIDDIVIMGVRIP